MLPAPSPDAQRRAASLPSAPTQTQRAPQTESAPSRRPDRPAYSRTLAAIAADLGERPTTSETPTRPPPGSPRVRPSVPAPPQAARDLEPTLAAAASDALLVADGDTVRFEIAFRDDILPEAACCITLKQGRVQATFRVADAQARRLFEGEKENLRARLEARGLRVDSVTVEVVAKHQV